MNGMRRRRSNYTRLHLYNVKLTQSTSLRASSRDPLSELGTERRACSYVSEFSISASKKSMRMLIGGDDIVMTSLPLTRAFTCFSMLFYIRARFRFALIGENLTAQSTGSHRGIGGAI